MLPKWREYIQGSDESGKEPALGESLGDSPTNIAINQYVEANIKGMILTEAAPVSIALR